MPPVGRASLVSPATARVLAPAKLNLNLRVIGLRSDGLHLIDSVIVPISLFDKLEIRVTPSAKPSVACMVSPSDQVPSDRRNLAVRAAELFLDQTAAPFHVSIRLEKRIPLGSGLGGGSSDAATVLLALNSLAGEVRPLSDISRWAAELGADVPFFLWRAPARVRGAGEIVEPLPTWPPWPVVVTYPGVPLATRVVYHALDVALTKVRTPSKKPPSAVQRVQLGNLLVNDLEAVATEILPRLHHLKQRLNEEGALGALMTGSGSAVFGVFGERDQAMRVAERMRAEGTWAEAAEIIQHAPAVRWVANSE